MPIKIKDHLKVWGMNHRLPIMNRVESVRRILALAKKEIRSFLISPVFYGAVLFFMLFVSIRLFYLQKFFLLDTASLRPFFSSFPLVYIFVIPALTMKSWAEEKKTGTFELLLSLPFSEAELCLGKFLSSLAALLFMLALSSALPASLLPLGHFDPASLFTEYLGALLLGASSISLTLFLSSLSKNQAASFLGSSAVLLVLTIPGQTAAGASLPKGLSDFVNYVSLSFHFGSFSRGLLDSRDLAFFILSTVLFLFLNTRVLIFRRWK